MQAMRWIGMAVLGAGCLCGGAAMATGNKAAKASQRAEAKGEAPDAKVDGKVNINVASKADL